MVTQQEIHAAYKEIRRRLDAAGYGWMVDDAVVMEWVEAALTASEPYRKKQ